MAEAFELRTDVRLGSLSTLGVGGPARFYVRARDVATIRQAVEWAATRAIPLFVLGGGSNVVVDDDGFPGLVLHVRVGGIEVEGTDDLVQIRAGAGVSWDDLVARSVAENLAGFECMSGIPGFVGATPIQNVGAYGQEVSETIVHVEALERTTGRIVEFANEDCRFGYRSSRFKTDDADRYIVLSVSYRLHRDRPPTIRYADLERYFADHSTDEPTLGQVREAVLRIRRGKGMVIDAADPDSRSAGSFFVNPIVDDETLRRIEEQVREELGGEVTVPRYPTGDGRWKLAAAWLIERAGFEKGFALGNVGISSRHTLAIVNRGGGTADEVVALARQIRDRVRSRFGVELTPEPVLVGLALD